MLLKVTSPLGRIPGGRTVGARCRGGEGQRPENGRSRGLRGTEGPAYPSASGRGWPWGGRGVAAGVAVAAVLWDSCPGRRQGLVPSNRERRWPSAQRHRLLAEWLQ